MKTLEEVMEGVTQLPWIIGTESRTRIFNVVWFDRHCDRDYGLRAANAFRKLVESVKAQKCECIWRPVLTISDHPARLEKCPRCALLEDVMK